MVNSAEQKNGSASEAFRALISRSRTLKNGQKVNIEQEREQAKAAAFLLRDYNDPAEIIDAWATACEGWPDDKVSRDYQKRLEEIIRQAMEFNKATKDAEITRIGGSMETFIGFAKIREEMTNLCRISSFKKQMDYFFIKSIINLCRY